MASFTELPQVMRASICQFPPSADLLSAASTTRTLRDEVMGYLSKRKPASRMPYIFECARNGPYIGMVYMSAHAESEGRLPDLMQWVGHLGALEWFGIANHHAVAPEKGIIPLKDWKWLRVVAEELRRARGNLSRLKYVRLCCHFAGGWVDFSQPAGGSRNPPLGSTQGDDYEDCEVFVEEVPSWILCELVHALPPSVTSLHLGPASRNDPELFVLKPPASVSLLGLLERGALPHLQTLICPVEVNAEVVAALASALRNSPFARSLVTLVLADVSGKKVPPLDLTPLISALGNCPRLRKLMLGPGQCEARHFSAFMDLVIAGTLPDIEGMPLLMELPVTFKSEGEMDNAVSKLIEALEAGRFCGTDSIVLGDSASHVPLPAATLSGFLAATLHMDFPRLYRLGLKAHVDADTPRLLCDWIARRPGLKYVSLTLVGGVVCRASEGEDALLGLIKHCAEGGTRLMLNFEAAGVEVGEEATRSCATRGPEPAAAVPSTETRCCVLHGLQEMLVSCRPPEPGSVVEISFAWLPSCADDCCRKEGPHKNSCLCKAQSSVLVNLRHIPEEELTWSIKGTYVAASGGQGNISLGLRADWLREEVLNRLIERRLALRACGKMEAISLIFSTKPGI